MIILLIIFQIAFVLKLNCYLENLPFNLKNNEVKAIFYDNQLYFLENNISQFIPENIKKSPIDLSVCGNLYFNASLARQGIALIDSLLPYNLNINVIGRVNLQDIQTGKLKDVLAKANKNNTPGNVAILEDIIHTPKFDGYKTIPQQSHIKYAYTMIESSRIPSTWVNILNQLDGLIVPDEYIKKVYLKSGIIVPIFVVPIGLYLEELLNLPKKPSNNKFVFGCVAMEVPRKNLELLISSFKKAFGNDPTKMLLIKWSPSGVAKPGHLENVIAKAGKRNIRLEKESLDWQRYINKINSFDCYVYISKGEGFSITPREAMAAGIPCILTNNTAQKTICKTGLVRVVESKIKEPTSYLYFSDNDNKHCGYHYNCNEDDVAQAMLDVYNNYQYWQDKAKEGREWVRQYTLQELSLKYLNIIKPKAVILGSENKVTSDYLMTSDESLFRKYVQLLM